MKITTVILILLYFSPTVFSYSFSNGTDIPDDAIYLECDGDNKKYLGLSPSRAVYKMIETDWIWVGKPYIEENNYIWRSKGKMSVLDRSSLKLEETSYGPVGSWNCELTSPESIEKRLADKLQNRKI
tara:strand:+ start:1591 stop:1971 length:381 start_codon:yes stop_codon:yes gene_type:complete